MRTLYLRFYEELNDFLPPARRNVKFLHEIDRNASVKDVIESLSVPHTEVELIVVNNVSVDFSYGVQNNDHIHIYPMFESVDINPKLRLREKPLHTPSFILDSNLGRLARYLRLLGFDCLYHNDYSDAEVAEIASQQHRTVLTRDRTLLRRKIIIYGYYVRAMLPRDQVKEILRRFDLSRIITPFSRCTHCNGLVSAVDKEQIIERLQPLTRRHYDDFKMCDSCGQIYWQGSHYNKAQCLLAELTNLDTDISDY